MISTRYLSSGGFEVVKSGSHRGQMCDWVGWRRLVGLGWLGFRRKGKERWARVSIVGPRWIKDFRKVIILGLGLTG